MNKVILVSGGLDSLLISELITPAIKVFVNYGQPYSDMERIACRNLFPNDLKEVDIRGLPEIKEIYVEARNLFLASIGVRYGDEIYMGGMKDDNCIDKTEEQFMIMSNILSAHCGKEISVLSPFWKTTKADAIYYYLIEGGSEDRLRQTVSCYKPEKCWNCEACFRWSVALRANGINVPMPKKEIITHYLSKLHTYCKNRQWTTLSAIGTDMIRVIECDIDGVLTEDIEGWGYEAYKVRQPNLKAIDNLNNLYKANHWIILSTSRREVDRDVTVEWLSKNKVIYHSLLMEKTPASKRIDDISEKGL